MKILSFHLVPYRDLPTDFHQHHDSICVDIDPELIDPLQVHRMYNDSLDEMELAAALGFDGVCVNEHHQSAYGMMPSPNLMAAALARRTKDAALCILGNSIVLYNPPMRVAEELAMLDCLSGGRVIAGFPVGTPMDSAYAYGQNPSMLRDRYREAHDLITRAWRERAVFAFNGRFYRFRYVNPVPRPLQRPHPPIWIPAGGSVETWRWCVEMDYVYCYLSYYGYRAAAEMMDGFWAEVQRAGKPPNPYRAAFLQIVGVAETREAALALYREPAEYFYRNCLHIAPRFVGPPGYSSELSARMRAGSQLAHAARSAGREGIGGVSRDWPGIVQNRHVLVGTPDEVASELRELAVRLNVGHLMLLLQFGNMTHDLAMRNVALVAERVLPQLRGVHAEWPDAWWPQRGAVETTHQAGERRA